jgi:hypothetical protein
MMKLEQIPEVPVDGDPNTVLVWALVVTLLSLISLLTFVVKGYRKISHVDRAVNNVTPGEMTLVERVSDIKDDLSVLKEAQSEFAAKGWGALPSDLDSSAHLTETIRSIQSSIINMGVKLDYMADRIERVDTKVETHLSRHSEE